MQAKAAPSWAGPEQYNPRVTRLESFKIAFVGSQTQAVDKPGKGQEGKMRQQNKADPQVRDVSHRFVDVFIQFIWLIFCMMALD